MANVHTITSGPRDRCPNCLGRTAVRPWSVRNGHASVSCRYRCPRCKHSWRTQWNAATLSTAELLAAGVDGHHA